MYCKQLDWISDRTEWDQLINLNLKSIRMFHDDQRMIKYWAWETWDSNRISGPCVEVLGRNLGPPNTV